MANLQPPSKKKPELIGEKRVKSVTVKKAIDQTPPDAIKSLQIQVPLSKAIEFKSYAAAYSMPMNKLFIEMFEEHKASRDQ
jgi:hypothetical protein